MRKDDLGLKNTGSCGILVKNIDIQEFEEMEEFMDIFLPVASDKQKIGLGFHLPISDRLTCISLAYNRRKGVAIFGSGKKFNPRYYP